MTQLDPLVVDLLDKAFVLAEQIAQMQPEERSVEEHELLVAYRAHRASRHDLRDLPAGRQAPEVGTYCCEYCGAMGHSRACPAVVKATRVSAEERSDDKKEDHGFGYGEVG